MAELMSDDVAAKIRAGLKGLPPGPWEFDGVRQDDAPDKHNEYELMDARGYRLCDTQNCDHRFGEIEFDFDEDGSSAWNEPARKLMQHFARCDPGTIGALLDELEAGREAIKINEAKLAAVEAERDALLEEMGRTIMAHPPGFRTRPIFEGTGRLRTRVETAEAALAKARESALPELTADQRHIGVVTSRDSEERETRVAVNRFDRKFDGLPSDWITIGFYLGDGRWRETEIRLSDAMTLAAIIAHKAGALISAPEGKGEPKP